MNEEFFVIGCTSNGMTFDGPLSKKTLAARMAEDYYGARKRFVSKNPGVDGFCLLLDEDELIVIKGSMQADPLKEI